MQNPAEAVTPTPPIVVRLRCADQFTHVALMGYLLNKNLGQPLGDVSSELPKHNSDGLPVIDLTDEQKYLFDKDGWILMEGVLSGSELDEMREFAMQLKHDPESLPKHEKSPLAPPLQSLLDHPLVVGFLNHFTAYPPLSSQECYGFATGGSHLLYRTAGEGNFGPHNGNGMFRFPEDVHYYEAYAGRAYCPHTRFAWELNPVKEGQGGTLLVTGSHKAAYTAPPDIQDPASSVWSTYSCPAGSLLIFAEATTHSGTKWTDEEFDRIPIFNLYNPVDSGWAPRQRPHPKLLEEMPPLRRSLFRPRHVVDNVGEKDFRRLYNNL